MSVAKVKGLFFRGYVIVILFAGEGVAATVAILGDSISTGAVSHPAIGFDSKRLNAIASGELSLKPLPQHVELLTQEGFGAASDAMLPRRLWFSIREFESGFSWFGKHTLLAVSSTLLDIEEFSWGNLVARNLGARPDEVLIAAEDGARMFASKRQLDRVLDHTRGVAPDHLFVLFTGNDLCGPTMSFVTSVGDYEEQVADLLDYYERNSRFPPEKTHVWLLDPIGALQLTFSRAIQEKVVLAHGKKMTCKELHNLDPNTPRTNRGVLSFLPQTPTAYCPMLLLNRTEEDKERLGKLGNRILGYREALGRQVEKLTKERKNAPYQLHHMTSSGEVILEPADIAEDCFHLSLEGQIKLAKAVFGETQKAVR